MGFAHFVRDLAREHQVATSLLAVLVTILIVFVTAQYERRKKREKKSAVRQHFDAQSLFIQVCVPQHSGDPTMSLRSCATHRREICSVCRMNFAEHNARTRLKANLSAKWPADASHNVLWCIPRKGVPQKFVSIWALKNDGSSVPVSDEDVVVGNHELAARLPKKEIETAATVSRLKI